MAEETEFFTTLRLPLLLRKRIKKLAALRELTMYKLLETWADEEEQSLPHLTTITLGGDVADDN